MPSVTALFNEQSLQAQLAARRNTAKAGVAMNQAATGLRTALPKYDSSAFAVSKTLTALTGVLGQADRNTANLSAAIGVALGGASEIADLLASMQTLATRANTTVLDSDTLAMVQADFAAQRSQITTIADTTRFNGTAVLAGSKSVADTAAAVDLDSTGTTLNFNAAGVYAGNAQVGSWVPNATYVLNWANATRQFTVDGQAGWIGYAPNDNAQTVTVYDMATGRVAFTFDLEGGFVPNQDGNNVLSLAVSGAAVTYSAQIAEEGSGSDVISATVPGLTVTDLDGGLGAADLSSDAAGAMTILKDALQVANNAISDLAAIQRRLEAQSSNLQVSIINTEAARSAAADADMSSAIGDFVKFNTAAKIASAMTPKANDMHMMFLEQVQATR